MCLINVSWIEDWCLLSTWLLIPEFKFSEGVPEGVPEGVALRKSCRKPMPTWLEIIWVIFFLNNMARWAGNNTAAIPCRRKMYAVPHWGTQIIMLSILINKNVNYIWSYCFDVTLDVEAAWPINHNHPALSQVFRCQIMINDKQYSTCDLNMTNK